MCKNDDVLQQVGVKKKTIKKHTKPLHSLVSRRLWKINCPLLLNVWLALLPTGCTALRGIGIIGVFVFLLPSFWLSEWLSRKKISPRTVGGSGEKDIGFFLNRPRRNMKVKTGLFKRKMSSLLVVWRQLAKISIEQIQMGKANRAKVRWIHKYKGVCVAHDGKLCFRWPTND